MQLGFAFVPLAMSLRQKSRPELIKSLCSVIQRQDLELNRLIDAQRNRLAIRVRTPSILPRQIQNILLPPLLPPFHLLAGPHIDEVPMPWQANCPESPLLSHAIPNEALNFIGWPGSKVKKKESVVNAAEHEAVGHALYGQAAHSSAAPKCRGRNPRSSHAAAQGPGLGRLAR